jgi:hypothetical protein
MLTGSGTAKNPQTSTTEGTAETQKKQYPKMF